MSFVLLYLKPGGVLMFEMGIGQAKEVSSLFEVAIWSEVGIENDFQGIPRVARARLKSR